VFPLSLYEDYISMLNNVGICHIQRALIIANSIGLYKRKKNIIPSDDFPCHQVIPVTN